MPSNVSQLVKSMKRAIYLHGYAMEYMQNCKSRCGEKTKIMISYASSLRGLAVALQEIGEPRSLR